MPREVINFPAFVEVMGSFYSDLALVVVVVAIVYFLVRSWE